MKPREFGRAGMASAMGRFVMSASRQWRELPADRRQRFQTLIRQSGARPSRLSAAERQELGVLMRELQLIALVRDAATEAAQPRGRYGGRF